MAKYFLFIFILVGIFQFTPVLMAHAADPGLWQLAQCSGTDCSACNVVHLANGVIKWLIGILFVLFSLLIAVAGIRLVMSGGNHHTLDEAKGMFTNAIIGLIIIFSAWLIVDTIMRALVGSSDPKNDGALAIKFEGRVTGYLFWSDVQCQVIEVPGESGQTTLNFNPHFNADTSVVPTVSGPAGMPVAGTGANCPVPAASGMVPIPGASGYSATPDTVSRFVAMRAAAASDGITLTITSAYRSEADQVGIWLRKGCDSNPANCRGTAARPCSYDGNGSNHNSGVALDISMGGGGVNSPIFRWLKANGGRYGFYNNLDSRDPFHWSPSGK